MKTQIEYDSSKIGLRAVLKDYQEIALRTLWESKEGLNSRAIWMKANEALKPESISRASIINFLNAMVDEGALSYTEITGKGGHRRIYSPPLDDEGFKRYVAKNVIAKLFETWPDATREAIEAITRDNG